MNLRKQLRLMNVSIKLVQIKGHSGMKGNHMADQQAKDTAFNMFKGNIPTPDASYIAVTEAYSIASEIAWKSWQRSWDNESTGRYTYELVPAVYTKLLFPVDRDTGISYCRMLLHDTMLQQDSFRSGTSVSTICECGTEEESVQHFLLRCQNFTGIRSELFNNIEDWVTSRFLK